MKIIWISLCSSLIWIILLSSCTSKPSPKNVNASLANAFISVWNTGDVNSLDTLLSTDFVRHSTPSSEAGAVVSGIEGMKSAVLVTRKAVSEFDFTAEEIIEMDSVIVLRCRLKGIFNRTGKPFDVPSIHILKVKDGKLSQHYSCLDHLDLYLQAGMKVVIPEKE
jgi:ketosteroid isomerase-like protein